MNAAANKATTTNKTNKKIRETRDTEVGSWGGDENHRWNRVNGIGIKENKKKHIKINTLIEGKSE